MSGIASFPSDLAEVVDRYHASQRAFVRGDPGPTKEVWSRRDDVTLANPLGPPGRGWDAVAKIIDRAASAVSDGVYEPETISAYAGADVAYIVELEHWRMRLDRSEEMASGSLRVTTIFRREDGDWKVVHRHADPITSSRPVASIVDPESAARHS